MKLTVPRSVVVQGVRYAVDVVPKQQIEDASSGQCITNDARILLARECAPEQRRSVYLHELGHAAFYESGAYGITKEYTAQPDSLEERILDVFLPALRVALGIK